MHVRNKAVLHVQIVLAAAVRKEAVLAEHVHKVVIPVVAVHKEVILAEHVHKVVIPVAAVHKEAILAEHVHKVVIPVAAVRKEAILVVAVHKVKAVHHAQTAAHKGKLALAEVSHAAMTEVRRRIQRAEDRIRAKDALKMVRVVTTVAVVEKMVVERISQLYIVRKSITLRRKLSFVAA